MPNAPRYIYWDTCVVLSYLDGIPDRLPTLDAILQSARDSRGQLVIVTSAISVAEVAYAESERTARRLDPAIEQQIDLFWADRSVLQLVEFHEIIGRAARDLVRKAMVRQRSLRSHDAVHLATAQWIAAAEFHTYDERLDKYHIDINCPIIRPATQQPLLPGMGTS